MPERHSEIRFSGPGDGPVCGANQCPPGSQWNSVTRQCESIVPVPGPGPGPAPTPTPIPIPPNSINPIDWIHWLGDVIIWAFKNLWLGLVDVSKAAVAAIWAIAPDWLKEGVRRWQRISSSIEELLTAPEKFGQRLVTGAFAETSPSLASDLTASFGRIFLSNRESTLMLRDLFAEFFRDLTADGVKQGEEWKALITGQVAEGGEEELSKTVFDKATKLILSLEELGIVIEGLSFGQMDSPFKSLENSMDILGLRQIASSIWVNNFQKNLGALLDQAHNARYRVQIPDINRLIDMRRLGRITDEQFRTLVPRASGLKADLVDPTYKMIYAPPNLDDIVTWNRRHPDQKIDLAAQADLLGLDFERYGAILQERQYNDLPILFARVLADLGELTEEQARKIAVLNGFKPEPNIRSDISDVDLVTKALFGRRTAAYNQQVLATTRRKYVLGLATEVELKAIADKYIHAEAGREAWLLASKNLKEIYTEKERTFPPGLLIQMLDEDVVDQEFADDQIDSYLDYTTEQKDALKKYVAGKVKPKKA